MTIAVEMAFEGGAGTLVADGCPEFGIAFVWYVIEIFIGQCAASAGGGIVSRSEVDVGHEDVVGRKGVFIIFTVGVGIIIVPVCIFHTYLAQFFLVVDGDVSLRHGE